MITFDACLPMTRANVLDEENDYFLKSRDER